MTGETPASPHYHDGFDAGRAAGSWVIDGNTTEETARAILRGIEDGDPETMDMQPAPLSGEWAGESIGELIDGYDEMSDEDAATACEQYECGYADGFWQEVERAAHALADPAPDALALDLDATYSVAGHGGIAWRIERLAGGSNVLCYMVGDDRSWTFDASDLTPLDSGDYCPECGQIGCKAYAAEV